VQYSLQDALGFGQSIIVSETNNAKTFFYEKARTGFVFCNLLRMLSAINFDD